uniref:aminopyrimidine aminohydrolase n=1 Tax=Kalanchoe fedtschenkoi TaxID=63787 RepID=A0A7N0UGZ1_KALFE
MEGGESKKDGGDECGGTIEIWLRKHALNFTRATRHPFILSIRDGSVDIASFKRWLEQDYLFVRAFVAFAASVLIKACKESENGSDMEVLLQGISALSDELAWFKSEAEKWGVSLSGVSPQPANLSYCRFLDSLMSQEVEYTVAITAFWAIETVYQDSFAYCLEVESKTPHELKETCKRWGNAAFGHYCRTLQKMANRQLHKAPGDVIKKTEATFLQVLDKEIDFWNMSHG